MVKNTNLYTVEAMNCADIKKRFTVKQFLLMETQKVLLLLIAQRAAVSTHCTRMLKMER